MGELRRLGLARFLCLGGRVYGDGVARVRLTDANGQIVQDVVDNGIALLLTNDPVEMPCRIDLLDASGEVLATQVWPPIPGSRPS